MRPITRDTETSSETYCSACRRWSPSEEWDDYYEMIDGEVADSSVVCPRCGHHHPPYDPKARQVPRCVCGTRNGQMGCAVHRTGSYANTDQERADMSDVDRETRWQAFSDEELLELRAGCLERYDQRALPEEIRARAAELSRELVAEHDRRRGRYRGPGVYRGNVAAEGAASPEYEVYGVVAPGSGANRMLVVRADPESDQLVMVPLRSFERMLSSNQPSYEWVRPLPGREER